MKHRPGRGAIARFVRDVKALGEWASAQSQDECRARMEVLRAEVRAGAPLARVLPRCFALVREAARRVLGLDPWDPQILAAAGLAFGYVVECAPGEGKTLVAAVAACLRALTGEPVHVATANAYLARRDFETLRPLYEAAGFTAGLVEERDPPEAKRLAYAADVVYGVASTFGFDYLRDELRRAARRREPLGSELLASLAGRSLEERARSLQRGLVFCVVDEVDSLLIDEARTPLVIAGSTGEPDPSPGPHLAARRLAADLVDPLDFRLDPATRSIEWTRRGERRVRDTLSTAGPGRLVRPWPRYVEQALRASRLYRRDVDYLLDPRSHVILVDQHTGRRFPERTWQEGLHQAVEAKEGVTITSEPASLASITRQRFFRLYRLLSGMSGTVAEAAREFRTTYRMPLLVVSPLRPCIRRVLPPRMFGNWESKWRAVVEEVETLHATGRPVLVGTRTIEQSEALALRLDETGLEYRLLNAKFDREEADILAAAGEGGRITIATNMAGRGADIRLGPGVAEIGGLHVIGVEMHESARIDRQLFGRAGRQGAPGSAGFFLGAEDMLLSVERPDLVGRLARRADPKGELPSSFSRVFDRLQRGMESRHFQARKDLLKRDRWLDELKAAVLS
ncbi:MAG: preprotein translocase subunit SecA [Planctomycetes bacterium]|nr:preprotein translocase subunit SecA [Planctomycetota bacterium]